MVDYKERIKECISYLTSVSFPRGDWKKDKLYFDKLEKEFSKDAADKETEKLLQELRILIDIKKKASLNMNKTAEELFAGWDVD